jgi:hypothetical protein
MVPVGYRLLQANAREREEYGIDLFQVLQEQEQQRIKWVEILDSVNYWCGVCVYLCAYLFSFLSFVDILGWNVAGSSGIYRTPQTHCTKQEADDPTFPQHNNAHSRV